MNVSMISSKDYARVVKKTHETVLEDIQTTINELDAAECSIERDFCHITYVNQEGSLNEVYGLSKTAALTLIKEKDYRLFWELIDEVELLFKK